jgi:hypothetical protein
VEVKPRTIPVLGPSERVLKQHITLSSLNNIYAHLQFFLQVTVIMDHPVGNTVGKMLDRLTRAHGSD